MSKFFKEKTKLFLRHKVLRCCPNLLWRIRSTQDTETKAHGSSSWPCFPHRYKIKVSSHLNQKSLPWNSTVQPPGEPQLTSGDTSSLADRLPLSCSPLPIPSVFGGFQSSALGVPEQPRVQNSRPGPRQLCRRILPGVTGQNGWLGSSRHNQQQPFYLYLPGKQAGIVQGRFTQGTWLLCYQSTGLTPPQSQLLPQENTYFISI